ncbi:MAG: nickel pincer cofactor biosynthesis protein LarB [Proteobacteria bacterium]|nr:nickel pincer cofactor biosynthesis protein LarB [Pseudomonadota bacterium]
MNPDSLIQLLTAVSQGHKSVQDAAESLKNLPSEDISYAHIDHHRCLRKGFPEVIFGEGKTVEQIIGIMERMIVQENVVLATRVDAAKADAILQRVPGTSYHPDARMLIWEKGAVPITGNGDILILSAGTSDIPVSQEAFLTAKMMGNRVESVYDVGVAGIHRLFRHQKLIEQASVIVVVAGMEGALPSVVAGMVQAPVIAVPTSVGYGISLKGMTALFAMLNSCSSNIAVVNIDNGFGAGYMASSINHIPARSTASSPGK